MIFDRVDDHVSPDFRTPVYTSLSTVWLPLSLAVRHFSKNDDSFCIGQKKCHLRGIITRLFTETVILDA
jgi:hypothetical protein